MVEINIKKDIPKTKGQSAGVWSISAESQGAGVGEALSAGSKQVGASLDKVVDKVDTTSAQDAANKFSEYSRYLTIGNGLPAGDENRIIGYKALRGQEAIDKRQEYEEKLAKKREELAAGLSSNARTKYDKVAQSHTARAQTSFGTHTLGAAEEVRTKVYTTNMSEQLQNAVANAATWKQPGSTVQASITAIGEATKRENLARFGADVAESMAESAMTKAHLQVIDALAVDNPGEAEKYLKAALKLKTSTGKPVLDADALTKLRAGLEESSRLDTSQKYADNVERRAVGLLWDPKIQAAERADLRKNFKGKDEKAAMAELERRFTIANKDRKADISASVNKAYGYIYDDRTKTLADFRKEFPEEFKQILDSPRHMGILTGLSAKLARGDRFPARPDGKTFKAFKGLETKEMSEVELRSLNLTREEYADAKALHKAATKKMEGKNGGAYTGGYRALKDAAPPELHWGLAKANKQKKLLAQEARNDMDVFVKPFTEDGTEPTIPQLRAEASRLMLKIKSDPDNTGVGIGGSVFQIEQDGEEAFSGYVLNADTMSRQQRAVARVPISAISTTHRKNLIDTMKGRNKNIKITNDLLSEFAAANALRDGPRVKRLLGIE
jgi:hypothetical protein